MRRSPIMAFWLPFLVFGANAIATRSSESEVDGKMLLQKIAADVIPLTQVTKVLCR
jgi:hypothetical protein